MCVDEVALVFMYQLWDDVFGKRKPVIAVISSGFCISVNSICTVQC